ncbi:MAG: TRAP transporter small permease [Microbacterium gubbeenense]|uniref:TRAP transporter small permease n=1 Tax=Microbacterium TaxID=33882 RepID=UPI003F9AB7D2
MARKPDPGESIFGHTDTVFPDPAPVRGAPDEPLPLRVFSRIEMLLSAVFFVGILVGVLYQVLGRYVPAVSWIGAGELALLSMVSLTFLMMGYLTGRNGHVTIEIFDRLLDGKKLFVALRIFSAVVMVVTCAWMVFDAWEKIGAEMGRSTAAIGIPMGIIYVFAFVGGLSAGIHSALKIPYANRPERQLEIEGM